MRALEVKGTGGGSEVPGMRFHTAYEVRWRGGCVLGFGRLSRLRALVVKVFSPPDFSKQQVAASGRYSQFSLLTRLLLILTILDSQNHCPGS